MMTPEKLSAWYAAMKVEPHPVLRLPTFEQAAALLGTGEGRERFVSQLNRRQERIALATQDPLNFTFEGEPTWADADRLLLAEANPKAPDYCYLLGLFGGNRAGKTWYAIKRAVETCILFARSKVAVCSESETASIATVQALVWFYIKRHYEHLNGKRHSVTSVNFSQKGGFTERKLIFPNGSEMHFFTYNQEPGDYEGWEFGAPVDEYDRVSRELRSALADPTGAADEKFQPISLVAWRSSGRVACPNIGAVCDESMPMSWLKMLSRRAKFRQAKVLWPFTPVKGITPSIKELVGASAATLEHRPSELLPGQNFPDLPKGTMPYIRKCVTPGARAIYFFSCFSKFGPSAATTYYDEIKYLCAGKTTEYIERVAYGYARDSIARAFPNFGPHNVVRREQIPANGANYMMFDPHGSRNFPFIWFRMVETRPVSLWIYREWPDAPTYGEWAVPTEREVNDQNRKGWDGDRGPAQTGMGWGAVQYKLEMARQERVNVPAEIVAADGKLSAEKFEAALRGVRDQYHQARIRQAWRSGESLEALSEIIVARYGDPRGLHNRYVSEQGGTTLYDQFTSENVDERTRTRVPAWDLFDAPTTRRSNAEEDDEGIVLVNEWLGNPAAAEFGQPRLFVCDECQNTIWMLANYTGRAGGEGACKDFADLVKYAVLADLEPEDTTRRGRSGRGY